MAKPRGALVAPERRLISAKGKAGADTTNEMSKYTHPLTGFEFPDEVHFAPRSSILIDDGIAHCPPRGLLHYLATGGGSLAGGGDGDSLYINPGDTSAWLNELDRRISELDDCIDTGSEVFDLETELQRLEEASTFTPEEILEMLAQARHGLASVKHMEEYLTSAACLVDPVPGRIDEIRRAILKQRTMVDADILKAKEAEAHLQRQAILRARLEELEEQRRSASAELKRLRASRKQIARNGIVKVTSSGWQMGEAHDVLSQSPRHSWSSPCWHERSPDHPLGEAAGAWFEVELPAELDLFPTHYSLRHGDDGCWAAPGVRHDSNFSRTALASETLQGHEVACASRTSWGSTTRAKNPFRGTAMLNWQLWARADSDSREWTLLSKHVNDESLHGAFQTYVWPLRPVSDGGAHAPAASYRIFRVIMTGPCSLGSHALMCSGFELYGQVGKETPPPPEPTPPENLTYQFPYELYITDGRAITPNRCTLAAGTDDEGCPMRFAAFPALPPGLNIDHRCGAPIYTHMPAFDIHAHVCIFLVHHVQTRIHGHNSKDARLRDCESLVLGCSGSEPLRSEPLRSEPLRSEPLRSEPLRWAQRRARTSEARTQRRPMLALTLPCRQCYAKGQFLELQPCHSLELQPCHIVIQGIVVRLASPIPYCSGPARSRARFRGRSCFRRSASAS